MTKRKEVSEKSLELNVCAEMLQHIRHWPGCFGAVWLGMTQRQERQNGLDELICNTPGLSLMLQFKSPWANSRVDYLYRFSINREQHNVLENLAIQYPDSVYYVFPLYSKWTKVYRDAPSLAKDTWLIPVSCISLDTSDTRSTLVVNLIRINSQIFVMGSFLEATCEPINAREFIFERHRDQLVDPRMFGVPSIQLREWLQQWGNSELRFNGLRALFLSH